jgi:lycopene beta-cyclase
MSYLEFLGRYLLPAVLATVVAAAVTWHRLVSRGLARWAYGSLAVYVLLALLWTAPWDSWLIANDVWRHGGVLGRVLRVPVEEYAFMIGQSLVVGLWTIALVATRPRPADTERTAVRWVAGSGWGVVAVAAWLLHPVWAHGFYLTAIVGWFAPLIAVQAAWGADRLAAARQVRLLAVAVPTAYLWFADLAAIRAGSWWINPERTVPVRPWGLPLEEAVFFFVTTLVLVNGIVLATDPVMWRRAERLRRRERAVSHV